jgi:hypothetical protein
MAVATKVATFTVAFDAFLRNPSHFVFVSAASSTINFFVDPTSFLVQFLKDVFGKSRSLVQFGHKEMIYPMCTAYRDVDQLSKHEFDPINRCILAEAGECQTNELLMDLLQWAVTNVHKVKIDAWNVEIRTTHFFQVTQSNVINVFDEKNQLERAPLRMSVDGASRTISFYDKSLGAAFSIENIQYRGVITTSTTQVTMIEFYGEWWWCKLSAPARGVRRSALFRIRAKPRTRRVPEKDLNHYALIDLFGNYLDQRRA